MSRDISRHVSKSLTFRRFSMRHHFSHDIVSVCRVGRNLFATQGTYHPHVLCSLSINVRSCAFITNFCRFYLRYAFCVGSAQRERNMRSFAQRTLGLAPLANQANLPDSQLRRDRAIKAQSSQYLSLSSQCTRNSVICPQFCPVSSFSREEKIECLETCLKTCLDMSGTCHVLSSI